MVLQLAFGPDSFQDQYPIRKGLTEDLVCVLLIRWCYLYYRVYRYCYLCVIFECCKRKSERATKSQLPPLIRNSFNFLLFEKSLPVVPSYGEALSSFIGACLCPSIRSRYARNIRATSCEHLEPTTVSHFPLSLKIPTASKFFLLQYIVTGIAFSVHRASLHLRYNRQADRSTTTSKHRSIDRWSIARQAKLAHSKVSLPVSY